MITRLELAKLTTELAATDLESERVALRAEIEALKTEAIHELYDRDPHVENPRTGRPYPRFSDIKLHDPELYASIYSEFLEELFE